MDLTLVINPGSSSKRYALFRGGTCVFSVLFEHTKDGFGKCVEMNDVRQRCETLDPRAYERGLHEFILSTRREDVIGSAQDVTRIAVRIVAPGVYFTIHRRIDLKYREELAKMRDAAPLHIPHIETELKTVEELFPSTPCFGVSDSAFHTTMPDFARIYGIPTSDQKTFGVYRFGYHGLSLTSAVESVQKQSGAVPKRMVVVHIGSGMSVTAIQDGKSVDTTMGFGPTSGLIMGTRAGDLDPAALLYLEKRKGMDARAFESYVSHGGGLLGLTGSSDLRVVLDRAGRGDRDAVLALDAYFYHVQKAIAAFIGVLGGIDALVLTGTALERNPTVRARVCERLQYASVALDEGLSESLLERDGVISPSNSSVVVYVARAFEMREMARIAATL